MREYQPFQLLNLTRGLFFVNSAVWFLFSAMSFMQVMTGTGNLRLIYSGLMLANAVVLTWLGIVIVNADKRIFFIAIVYMALNVVLSVTDQFGWIDASILLLNLVTLGLLFVARQRMQQTEQ